MHLASQAAHNLISQNLNPIPYTLKNRESRKIAPISDVKLRCLISLAHRRHRARRPLSASLYSMDFGFNLGRRFGVLGLRGFNEGEEIFASCMAERVAEQGCSSIPVNSVVYYSVQSSCDFNSSLRGCFERTRRSNQRRWLACPSHSGQG